MKLILEKGSFSLTKREAAALVAVDQWLDKKIAEPEPKEKKSGNRGRK